MTILLTGGTGFLGSHVAEQLSLSGRKVRALVRSTSNTRMLEGLEHVELVPGSVEDRHSLLEAVKGATHVIHAAGLVKARTPAEFHLTNAGGTTNLIDAIRANAPGLKRLVLVSSLAVAGPSLDGKPVTSGAKPNPVTDYGRSKLAAERAVLHAKGDIPVTIIRPPMIYGPRDKEVLAFFRAVKLGVLPQMGSGTRGISAVFGADCAAACVAALDGDVPSGSAYFVEDGDPRTYRELVVAIEQALGRRAWMRVPVPRRLLHTAALGVEVFGKLRGQAVMLTRDKCNELYAPHWVCDATEIRRDLQWEPKVTFAHGARLTADWYRREGWL